MLPSHAETAGPYGNVEGEEACRVTLRNLLSTGQAVLQVECDRLLEIPYRLLEGGPLRVTADTSFGLRDCPYDTSRTTPQDALGILTVVRIAVVVAP